MPFVERSRFLDAPDLAYAITGLRMELDNEDGMSSEYISEKVGIIVRELQRLSES